MQLYNLFSQSLVKHDCSLTKNIFQILLYIFILNKKYGINLLPGLLYRINTILVCFYSPLRFFLMFVLLWCITSVWTQLCCVWTAAHDIQGNAGMSGIPRILPCPLEAEYTHLNFVPHSCWTNPTRRYFPQKACLIFTTCFGWIFMLSKSNLGLFLLTKRHLFW